jgi:hypothetical protein
MTCKPASFQRLIALAAIAAAWPLAARAETSPSEVLRRADDQLDSQRLVRQLPFRGPADGSEDREGVRSIASSLPISAGSADGGCASR